MNRRLLDKIITALFCAAIFAAPVLFLLLPKQHISEREKRVLSDRPELSVSAVADGSFMEKLGDYVADHFPGREFFTGVNAYYDLLSGRQDAKDYRLVDGRLFARPVETDRQVLEKNIARINDFSRSLNESGIPVDLMLVPSSGAVLLPDREYPDEEMIGEVYARTETGHVDLLTAFRSCAEPERLYYRTDHHWTSEGAFEAACAWQRSLGRECPRREDYALQSYGPFYGSAYSASGLWLTEPDSIELWFSRNRLQVCNETGRVNSGVFYPERLEEWDSYTVFLDGNHSLVRIENLSRGGGRNLLVIRDSFSNALGCFLADLCDRVVLVDLRYYKLPLSDLIREEEISEVLLEYSTDNFLHDANLEFLSADPEALLWTDEQPQKPPNYFAPPPALSEEIFDGAYYVGDSIIWTLASYCTENGKLPDTYIATNSLLSYNDLVTHRTEHMIYRGNYTTLPAVLEKTGTKVLISGLGCNDLATFDLEHCENSVLAFLDMARETTPDITIFLQSVMPVHNTEWDFNQQEIDAFNAWLRDNAEANGYCYIELDRYFKGENGGLSSEYTYNSTHINRAGGAVWYEQIMNIDNYYNFPEKFCVEYDGATGLPVESAPAAPAPEPELAAAETPREETVLDRIYSRIDTLEPEVQMMELDGRNLSYLGLQPEEFRDGRFYVCSNGLKADEIWLVEMEDETAAQAMLSRARERIQLRAATFDKYLPEESALARRGIALARGRFVGLVISGSADQMKDVFLDVLGQTEEG